MDRPSAGRLAGNRRIAEGRRDDPRFRLLLSGPPGDEDRTDETCTGPVLPRKTIDIEKAGDAFRKARDTFVDISHVFLLPRLLPAGCRQAGFVMMDSEKILIPQ